jgi:peptidoglycan-associated lipoprotein
MSTVSRSWGPLVVIAMAGVGCHTRPPAVTPSRTMAAAPAPAAPTRPLAPAPAPAPPRPVAAPAPAPLTEAELFQRKSLDALNAERPLGDAFFDYDQEVLRDDAKRALQQDAAWLSRWPQTRISVEGHCDERGTPEYNLALGDRRAEVVKDYLTNLGVASNRIVTRSLGREAPFCRDSGESCWSQNRRGHFVITAK